jgi:hypothetical protein
MTYTRCKRMLRVMSRVWTTTHHHADSHFLSIFLLLDSIVQNDV